MRAAVFHEIGGPEVVRIEDVPRPTPGPGEVLLRVRAAALNHLDLWVRRGLPIETTMPHIGGSDVAGEVHELGAGVTGIERGALVVVDPSLGCGRCEWCLRGEQSVCNSYRILGEHTQGGFAEFVVAPAANLYRLPAGTDPVFAAAAPLAYLTAWRALKTRARLAPGESVLITGASGGVASAAVQIAALLEARVYAVTTGANVERVRALGAHVVYDRERVDYAKEIWRDTSKRGVDVVLDSVGATTWQTNVRALARLGRLVVYGATTGAPAVTDLRTVFWKQLEIIGTTMSTHAEFREVMDLVFSGKLQPVVDSVLPLSEARAAHERLERGQQFGKIVLVP
ncbi:MAG: alcohol dehydrogenase catalytic domain-containing protein [Longimicrobiales bacterium]